MKNKIKTGLSSLAVVDSTLILQIVILQFIYVTCGYNIYIYSERVKVVVRPSNAKMLYTDEKSTETGEIKEYSNRKVKRNRNCVATLSDFYPSTCLAWEALPGVRQRIAVRVFEIAHHHHQKATTHGVYTCIY